MTDSARLMLTLRRTTSATELLVTATVSTSIKLPPSQLHVERNAPLSPVFYVTMKGTALYTAKDAVKRFLRMYQDPASSLYSSSTSRAIFAGSEIEVVKYTSAASIAPLDRPLPPLSVGRTAPIPDSPSSFTFRPTGITSPQPRPSSPPTRRSVSLATWSSSVVALKPAKPEMSVQHLPTVNFPYRRRPSLGTWFSDKTTLKPAVTAQASATSVKSPRAKPVEKPQVKEVRRSSSSLRLKSPVRPSEDEEQDPFPKPALRGKVVEKKRSGGEGTFSVLSEAAKRKDDELSRSELSAGSVSRSRRTASNLRRQSSLWEDEKSVLASEVTETALEESEAAEPEPPGSRQLSEGESSTGWSWLWGGGGSDEKEDEEEQEEKSSKQRRKKRG